MKKIKRAILLMFLSTFTRCSSQVIENDKKDSNAVYCNGKVLDLETSLLTAAKELDGTLYSNGGDCSGIFHRVVDILRKECPELEFPELKISRSSREIAVWYHEHDQLKLIAEPAMSGDLIVPGAVMFYGYGLNQGIIYDRHAMTIESVRQRGTGINHVAIVTSVVREDGKVISYKIFHGLNPRKPATTTEHFFEQQRYPEYGYYSHWDEPWLAVSNVLVDN